MSVSVTGETPAAPSPPVSKLRGRLLRGAVFEMAGFGSQQVLRLASNLILTRLLFPAAFGIVSIVSLFTTGLVMLSDIGIGPCIIQSKRGDDPDFLNSAFTLQAARGPLLALFMVALAKPAAWFYREPQLAPLVAVGAIQLLITGLQSTSIFTLRRSLRLGWVNGLEFCMTLVTIPLTIILAKLYPSPWSLVASTLLGALISTIASHFLPVGYHNRFHWDRSAIDEIKRFGRWIMGSSTATFLGGQSDRILLGRFLGVAWLGVYGIAVNLSDMLAGVVTRVVNGVMYPALSEAGRLDGPGVADFYYRLRKRLDLLSMSSAGFLAATGGWFVHLLWDRRYADAAWILQILCVRTAMTLMVSPTETCLFSLGHTRYGFLRSMTRLLGSLVCLPIGWHVAGIKGVIWGTVITEFFTFFAVWPKIISLGILRLRNELRAVGIFGAAYGLGWFIRHWLPDIHIHR